MDNAKANEAKVIHIQAALRGKVGREQFKEKKQ
jgi:hypothetical protein